MRTNIDELCSILTNMGHFPKAIGQLVAEYRYAARCECGSYLVVHWRCNCPIGPLEICLECGMPNIRNHGMHRIWCSYYIPVPCKTPNKCYGEGGHCHAIKHVLYLKAINGDRWEKYMPLYNCYFDRKYASYLITRKEIRWRCWVLKEYMMVSTVRTARWLGPFRLAWATALVAWVVITS
jgi:hypothetical protein